MTKRRVYNRIYSKEAWEKVLKQNKVLMDDFMLELKHRRASSKTIEQYFNDIRIFLIYVLENLENKSVLDITRKDMRSYSLWMIEEKGMSVARHNRLLAAMKSFYNYLEDDDDLDFSNNIARKMRGLARDPVTTIIFLTDEQVLGLRDELIRREMLQHAALLMLAYDSAARKGELAQVHKYSFYEDGVYNTNKVIGKGRKIFPLVYFDGAKDCARKWLEKRGDDEFSLLWVSEKMPTKAPLSSGYLYHMLIEMREVFIESTGLNIPFNLHSLRHSALQNMSDGTHYICRERGLGRLDITTLKEIANHDNISTTEGYLKDGKTSMYEETFGISLVD